MLHKDSGSKAALTCEHGRLTHEYKMIRDYYNNQFRTDLAKFMPDARVPYFGHSWGSDCRNLDKIQIESRPAFLICLYFTVLVDQAKPCIHIIDRIMSVFHN